MRSFNAKSALAAAGLTRRGACLRVSDDPSPHGHRSRTSRLPLFGSTHARKSNPSATTPKAAPLKQTAVQPLQNQGQPNEAPVDPCARLRMTGTCPRFHLAAQVDSLAAGMARQKLRRDHLSLSSKAIVSGPYLNT